ncbi:hypothetical protein CfE428DRAFT_6280 [Chthoniobacter flavus Ellin428]|uniref:Uncharacterized protein n=1 Tax=Chthoniobacter flavus Ellin428 TaxID=497964 RepID=B4DBI9_9BACT|nr:hypothetical protein [Chthoniobacter flavus]EDY16176.1 hypothetical protein CfE428DRAFT_6280 [Chthoniobacter flavus Ellin428]TCO87177.1 hypothetical protein EV701_12314 [Chthoniobacter flavus]
MRSLLGLLIVIYWSLLHALTFAHTEGQEPVECPLCHQNFPREKPGEFLVVNPDGKNTPTSPAEK